MPYRRLPNTDKARQRALETALKQGNENPHFKLAFSQASLQRIKYFLPTFNSALVEYHHAYDFQVQKSKEYNALLKKAKLYISHFVQVLNFSIARGEISADSRKFFHISESSKRVPSLNTEESVIKFGEKVIKGEQDRIAARNNPLTNPTIAMVRVHYEKFLEAHRYQKNLQEIQNRALTKIAGMRHEADSIILDVWNEVEDSFADLTESEKRENSMKYGLVYVYRKNEKQGRTKKVEQTLNMFADQMEDSLALNEYLENKNQYENLEMAHSASFVEE